MIVGFVGTRFAGLDGVTLESAKVAQVVAAAGHEVVWFAGELGPEFTPGREHPPAHFLDPDNLALNAEVFGRTTRSPAVGAELRRRADGLRRELGGFVADFEIDALVVQQALAIPLQLPLGLAIADLLLESGIAAVAHHHDFVWERERFWPNSVPDVLAAAFPPALPGLRHAVINSWQVEELARRKAVPAALLPNVMDFETGPAPADPARFRHAAGLAESDLVLLQPTRVISRKSIETTLELAHALGDEQIRVVVTHPEQDEGGTYWPYLQGRAELLGVDLRLVAAGGGAEPDLGDAYAAADLVCYPSRLEGFGNAVVETFFHRRPLLVNRYHVYARDIAPTGVHCLEMEERITPEVVEQAAAWLGDPQLWAEAAEHNYAVGLEYFSYRVVRERFLPLLG